MFHSRIVFAILLSVMSFQCTPVFALEDMWPRIDAVNKTLGPKQKMPPAYKIFQEQFQEALNVTRDTTLRNEFQKATDKANDTDDFREVTRLKKRAEPAFLFESFGDSTQILLDLKYVKSRAMEGSSLRDVLALYGRLHADVAGGDEPAEKCLLPFGNVPEAKAMKRETILAELKKENAKLADGFVKKKFTEVVKCVGKRK